MSEKIYFRGRVYRSSSEMDPDTRQIYERLSSFLQDKNRDGVPDAIQEGGFQGIKEAIKFMKDISVMNQAGQSMTQEQMAIIKVSDTSITFNGRRFRDVTAMPPDVRRVFERVVAKAASDDPAESENAGIYDEPWRERDRDSYFKPHDDENIQPQYLRPPTQNVMEPVASNLGLVIAAILAIVFIAIGALIWISGGNLF